MENRFELRSKNYFLTFSQCETLHGECLARIKEAFLLIGRRVVRYIIARERHSEDGHHLHCFIEIDQATRRFVASNHFDQGDHHPNIQGVRSCRRVIRYITKDQNFITNDENMVKEAMEKWGESKKEIAKKLLSGTKLSDMLKEHPELLFGYSRLKTDLEAARADTMDYPASTGPIGIWIGGKSGIGKSFFARKRIPEELGWRVYSKPNNERFWMGYQDEECIAAEDVGESWKPSHEPMLIWADEHQYIGETKGGYRKIKPKWFVVTSNWTLDEWLSKCGVKEDYEIRKPWLRRFREYYITDREEFEEVIKYMKNIDNLGK